MNHVGRVVATSMFCSSDALLQLRSLAALLFFGAGGQHGGQLVGVDETFVVDFHLVVSLVDFVGGELVAPGHEGVPQSLGVDLAVAVEGLEGGDDNIVFVGATGHAVREQCEELSEVDGARGLTEHLVEFLIVDEPAQGVEGGAEVVLTDDTVLVVVH